MAQRRSLFDSIATPASPMTPSGAQGGSAYDDTQPEMAESKDTFRRRTTPVTGQPEVGQTTLQEILAMTNGAH